MKQILRTLGFAILILTTACTAAIRGPNGERQYGAMGTQRLVQTLEDTHTDRTAVEGGIELCKQSLARGLPCTAYDARTGQPIASAGSSGYTAYGYGSYAPGANDPALAITLGYQTQQQLAAQQGQIDELTHNQRVIIKRVNQR